MIFQKNYIIDIEQDGAIIHCFSCDYCKHNPKCLGIFCKLRWELYKLGLSYKEIYKNYYRYTNNRIPFRGYALSYDDLKKLKNKWDTLHGNVLVKKGAIILNNQYTK